MTYLQAHQARQGQYSKVGRVQICVHLQAQQSVAERPPGYCTSGRGKCSRGLRGPFAYLHDSPVQIDHDTYLTTMRIWNWKPNLN